MKDFTVFTVTFKTGDTCEMTGEEYYRAFKYALDNKTGKFYSDYTREELDQIQPDQVVHTSEVFSIDYDDVNETLKYLEMFNIDPVDHYDSVYTRIQHYGGAEEGGWYYHTVELTDLNIKASRIAGEVEAGLDQYGEGLLHYPELIRGSFESKRRPYYC